MTVIELSDRQAEALRARAEALGLSLEEWLNQLAEEQAPVEALSPNEAVARILRLQQRVQPDPEGWTIRDYLQRDRP